jgi:hypothetical protein
LTAGAGGFATTACAAGVADAGTSFITGALAAGAAGGFAGAAAEPGFSAAGGLASSSAMMRRIDARISSIEGSWTFAGCVISDSTSSTPSHAFYTKHDRILPIPDAQAGIFTAQPDLSPDQAPLDTSRGIPPLLKATKRRVLRTPDAARIALLPPGKVCHGNNRLQATRGHMIRQIMPSGESRSSALDDPEGVSGYGDQRPSGMRTPYQLSRT